MISPAKKLTITFPLYGQHEMVKRAFTALANQTCQDFKIVCLDDQSPEPFVELANEFKNNLDISIQYNKHNLGAMLNIWQSIQLPVDTPYVFSHHADDFLKADYLERAIDILDKNPNISFVVTGPVWVKADASYTLTTLGDTPWESFSTADFVYNILNFAPYIFGSVVYRRDHLITDWKLETMDTYADRYFLGEILRTNKSQGAYIHGQGIFERDHAQDITDTRSPSLNENHALALLGFYKELLLEKYSVAKAETIITNALLYYYGNFSNRTNLYTFYKKSRQFNLLQLHRVRALGLYALVSLPFSVRWKRCIIQIIKKVIPRFLRKI